MRGKLRTLSLLYVVCCVIQLTTAQCDGGPPLTLTEQGVQEFTTPNFPDGRYPTNARCSWLIQVTSGTIELQFPDFNLPDEIVFGSAPCGTTKVQVYDGPTTSSPLIGIYCDNTPPPTVTLSTGNAMLVSFTGNFFVTNGLGFRATFAVIGGTAETTTPLLPDSTTAVHMTTLPLTTTIPPTTSTSSTAASTTPGQTSSEVPTTKVPETTTTPTFTTTKLTTTTPEPTTDPSTTIGTTQPVYTTTTQPTHPPSTTVYVQQDTTTMQPTDPPSTTLQRDTTTPPPTNSSPQDTTALPTTTTQRTTYSPQNTTNEMRSTPPQTSFAVTTTKTTSDKYETGQPFNVSTMAISTVDTFTETTRPITNSTRHPDNKPVTTEKPGSNEEQSGVGGLTEDQMIMYAAIGGALSGLLFVGVVAAVYFCKRQRHGSYAIGFQELETLDGGFGHAINNPIYDRSDLDANGRYNPAYLEASRPDSAYQSLQGSLQGSRAPSVDSQQDMEMDVKL